MVEKKYKLTKETINIINRTLHRIEALRDFGDVKKGDKGGFVENESNLSQNGNCWIYDNAKVYCNAKVCSNAKVCNSAAVFDNAIIYDNVAVYDYAGVSGNAEIYGNARIYGDTFVHDNAKVLDNAAVSGNAEIYGNARLCDNTEVYDNARVCDNAEVFGNIKIYGDARVCSNAIICGNAIITSNSDYIVFKNWWSSGRSFTWTRSNNMWRVGCFYGTGKQLIEKAYKDSELSGREYKRVVDYVNLIIQEQNIKERLLSKIRKLFGR